MEGEALQTQPLEVDDFSGGFTDYYIAGALNRGQKFDNLLVFRHGDKGKLLSRQGSQLYSSSYPLVIAGAATRVGALKTFGGYDLVFGANKVYYLGGGGWTELKGPTNNSLFPSSITTANVISYSDWENHLLVTCDGYPSPAKIYLDGSNNLQLRTAGLPRLASNPTITPGANTGKSFLYRFIHTYTYTVGTVTYKTFGGYVQVQVNNADAPNLNANAITAIPVLANGATLNYDTATISIEIYRTQNNGTDFFYVGAATNGTTTFNDNVSDATLVNNTNFYMNGGVVENGPVPTSKMVHVPLGDVAYYANCTVSGQVIKNRVYQTTPGTIDSIPPGNFADLIDNVAGISSVRGLPIAICEGGSVWRLDGRFDIQGRGAIIPTKISDIGGCTSVQSIVQTIEGVFWWGTSGIYFTDGYKVIKVNSHWPLTYSNYVQTSTQQLRVQGKYDQFYRRIWWVAQSSTSGAADCDTAFILHLDAGISEECCFTTASGGTQFAPSSIEFKSNTMLRGHALGYLLLHKDSLYTDPRVDQAVLPANWDTLPITFNYRSSAFNFGTSFIRKFVPRIVLTFKNVTNVSVQINSINDDGRLTEALKPLRYRGNAIWEDQNTIWGNATDIWAYDGLIEEQRRMPRKSTRCSYKQIQITNAEVVILSSDTIGTGTVNNTAKTITLTNVANSWPTDAINYYLSFAADSYSKKYLVTARTSATVLTFADTANTCPAGVSSWELRGVPKGEVINLMSYTLHYLLMGKTQTPYTWAESGEVGSSTR
jgi:hypothetical protein